MYFCIHIIDDFCYYDIFRRIHTEHIQCTGHGIESPCGFSTCDCGIPPLFFNVSSWTLVHDLRTLRVEFSFTDKWLHDEKTKTWRCLFALALASLRCLLLHSASSSKMIPWLLSASDPAAYQHLFILTYQQFRANMEVQQLVRRKLGLEKFRLHRPPRLPILPLMETHYSILQAGVPWVLSAVPMPFSPSALE